MIAPQFERWVKNFHECTNAVKHAEAGANENAVYELVEAEKFAHDKDRPECATAYEEAKKYIEHKLSLGGATLEYMKRILFLD